MARALAIEPKLLLLDEIAGGLTEYECGELVKTIKDIHARGTTIVWIEHIVHALISVASRLIVMNFGQFSRRASARAMGGSAIAHVARLAQNLTEFPSRSAGCESK